MLERFWDDRTDVFRRICLKVVMGEDSLTKEQKDILNSVIFAMNDMEQERVEFDLSENGAIDMGLLPILGLKDIYNNRRCCENLIRAFDKVVEKRMTVVRTENGRKFEKWTSELVGKIKTELCKFNAELHEFEIKITELNDDIQNKKAHMELIELTRKYIAGLLKVQNAAEGE